MPSAEYNLHYGANLVSFPFLKSDGTRYPIEELFETLDPEFQLHVQGIIGTSAASNQIAPGVWVGSISDIDPFSGYWLIMSQDFEEQVVEFEYDIKIPINSVYSWNIGAGFDGEGSFETQAKLISYPGETQELVENALRPEIQHMFSAIIGEGEAISNISYSPTGEYPENGCPTGGCIWVGNLEFKPNKGYWFKFGDDEINTFHNVDYSQDSWSSVLFREIIYGCTDINACNFNSEAISDDGSCTYPDEYYDCDGICINDMDGDGICDEFEIIGCMEEIACNYNPDATDPDPDSCIYPENPSVDCDGNCLSDVDNDGICDEFEISGCMDSSACNFNPQATDDDGTCEYPADRGNPTCDCNGNPLEGYCDCRFQIVDFCNFCRPANNLIDSDGNGFLDSCEGGECIYEPFCIDGDSDSCDELDDCNVCRGENQDMDECGECFGPGPEEGYDCFGNCLNDFNGDGICDEDDVYGCMDNTACNFHPLATVDDGCIYPIEYYQDSDGDGLLDPGPISCGSVCPGGNIPTYNNYPCLTIDNEIDEFPDIPAGQEVFGCMDTNACNYNSNANIDDGSCFYEEVHCYSDVDNDGIGDPLLPCDATCLGAPCPEGCVTNLLGNEEYFPPMTECIGGMSFDELGITIPTDDFLYNPYNEHDVEIDGAPTTYQCFTIFPANTVFDVNGNPLSQGSMIFTVNDNNQVTGVSTYGNDGTYTICEFGVESPWFHFASGGDLNRFYVYDINCKMVYRLKHRNGLNCNPPFVFEDFFFPWDQNVTRMACGGQAFPISDYPNYPNPGWDDVDVIYGCMDEQADNYNVDANLEDGSCEYYFCGIVEADNYNYWCGDHTCTGDETCVISGCTDINAYNYTAICSNYPCTDDGSCLFPPEDNNLTIFDLNDFGTTLSVYDWGDYIQVVDESYSNDYTQPGGVFENIINQICPNVGEHPCVGIFDVEADGYANDSGEYINWTSNLSDNDLSQLYYVIDKSIWFFKSPTTHDELGQNLIIEEDTIILGEVETLVKPLVVDGGGTGGALTNAGDSCHHHAEYYWGSGSPNWFGLGGNNYADGMEFRDSCVNYCQQFTTQEECVNANNPPDVNISYYGYNCYNFYSIESNEQGNGFYDLILEYELAAYIQYRMFNYFSGDNLLGSDFHTEDPFDDFYDDGEDRQDMLGPVCVWNPIVERVEDLSVFFIPIATGVTDMRITIPSYYFEFGCMDENACNYSITASADDGSCVYPEEFYDCDGNYCIGENEVLGCDGICNSGLVEDVCGTCGGDITDPQFCGGQEPVGYIQHLLSYCFDCGGAQYDGTNDPNQCCSNVYEECADGACYAQALPGNPSDYDDCPSGLGGSATLYECYISPYFQQFGPDKEQKELDRRKPRQTNKVNRKNLIKDILRLQR